MNKKILLTDGRKLSYTVYGSLDGFPILYFHGVPGSRLEVYRDNKAKKNAAYCVVAVDRPGYGYSDPHPKRTPQSFARDIGSLIGHFGWSEFSILSFSGATPYALACAQLYGSMVRNTGICCGLAPMNDAEVVSGLTEANRMYWELAGRDRDRLKEMLDGLAHDSGAVFNQLTSSLHDSDLEILSAANIANHYRKAIKESVRQGSSGILHDTLNLVQDWHVDFASINSKVHLWFGDNDHLAPPIMRRVLMKHLPDANLKVYPQEGHYLIFRYWEGILKKLVEKLDPMVIGNIEQG